MPDARYALDASVLVEASRRYYAFDIAPVFWKTLLQHAEGGRVLSIDRVRDEIVRGKDDLADWAKCSFAPWFVSTDHPDTIDEYGRVAQWVYAQSQFTEAAKAAFLDGADGWLVACALSGGCAVVTQEAARPGARKSIKIPDVCRALGPRCIDTFGMLRELGVRWA